MRANELLINNRYCTEHFNRDEYPMLYARMQNELDLYFKSLAENTATSSDASHDSNDKPCAAETESALRADIDEILDEVQAHRDSYRFNFRKESAFADDHLLLSLFIAPAAAGIGSPIANRFAELLAERFMERFPESTFKIGNYDEIMEGFKWKITLTLGK